MNNRFPKSCFKISIITCLLGMLLAFIPSKHIFGNNIGLNPLPTSENAVIVWLVDTVQISEEDIIFKDSARLAIEERTRRAYKRSMFVPGWGQITNGGIWWIKVPLIYGGFVTAGLVFEFNNRFYQSILKDVQYRLANNHAFPPNSPYEYIAADPQGTQYLINAKDYYRRNRDITIFATIGWYALNVVEAYVDSMLKFRWEVDENLQAKWTPTIIPVHPGQSNQLAFGMKFKFNINQSNYKP